MSDEIAIQVRGLGKKYTIGGPQEKYYTIRDAIANSVKAPFRRLNRHRASQSTNEFSALKDVSFDVYEGEVIGIIGRNGAGKSTLLKVLSQITTPTEGEVDIYGRVGSLLEVGTGFHQELTGRENIFLSGSILGMQKSEIEAKLDAIVKFSEIEKFLDTPVKRYSSGMYVRLAFAVAAHMETEILLVDEVLAVGDAAFQKKCLGKMGDVAKEGRTVLFVSHNMGVINRLCSKCVWLQNGSIRAVGETKEIISGYLTQGDTSSAYVTFPRRSNKIVQYNTICVTDKRGNVFQQIPDDQEFFVHCTFEAHQTTPIVYFGLRMDNAEGVNVLFSDSRDVEQLLPNRFQQGIHDIFLCIPPIFSPGKYFISMGIASTNPIVDFDNQESVCSFEIINNSNVQRIATRPGIINLKLPWTLGDSSNEADGL